MVNASDGATVLKRTNGATPSRLQLLSGFELTSGEHRVRLPMHAQRVIAFLALQDRPVARTYVAGTLWLDSSDARSNASLRSSLWRIGRVAHSLIEASNGQLRLARCVAVDVHEVTRLFDAPDTSTALDVTRCARALGGDLLPGWYDDWVVLERERLRQLLVHSLERACCSLVTQRRYADAIEAGLAAVRNEPLRESAYRALIAAYLAEGNLADAVRHYRAYERSLREELAIAPSRQIQEMVGSLITRR